jgi:hypothetical protein
MKKLRWKRKPRETGLSAIGAAERGWFYHDGEKTYATVSPLVGRTKETIGWYWVAGWDSNIPHENTCGTPNDTPESAKMEAVAYVKRELKKQ